MAKRKTDGKSGRADGAKVRGKAGAKRRRKGDADVAATGTASQVVIVLPSHDQIAARAYELWQNKGQPLGQDAQTWHEAECELKTAQ